MHSIYHDTQYGGRILNWLQILKESKWEKMAKQVLNDEFPIHKDYILYSKLMRDNKKMVDYYLREGLNASKEKQKEYFKLMLGEMRRDNNFNYWLEDESKMLKGRPPQWDVPHTIAKWYAILENSKSVNEFRKLWEKRKDWEPKRGTLGKAQDLFQMPKNTFILQLVNYILKEQGLSGREAEMQKPILRNNLSSNYDLISDVIQEIKDKPLKRVNYNTPDWFIEVSKEYIEKLVSGGFQAEDWADFEQEAKEVFSRHTVDKNRRRLIRQYRETLGDNLINKVNQHIPEKGHETLKEYLIPSGFRDEESEVRFSSSFSKDYESEQIDLSLAIRYLERYTEFKSIKWEGVKYSTDLLKLKEKGKVQGRNVLAHLQRNTRKNRRNWTSKLFKELLQLSGDLTGLQQFSNWARQIKEKYTFRQEELKEAFMEESWRMANDEKASHSLGWRKGEQFTLQGWDESEGGYKAKLISEIDKITDNRGELTDAHANWLKYLKEKKVHLLF